MRKSFFPGTTGIFALFFVPYIVTIIFNGANTTLINKKFNVEMLLPVIVSSQIEDKYELETIKAQTIIARSNFYRTMKEEKNLAITLCQIKEEMEGKSLACVILQNKYEKAVTETEGKVIVWNKELKLVPYHELSAGQTRDGMEVFHNEDDSYLFSNLQILCSAHPSQENNIVRSLLHSQTPLPSHSLHIVRILIHDLFLYIKIVLPFQTSEL